MITNINSVQRSILKYTWHWRIASGQCAIADCPIEVVFSPCDDVVESLHKMDMHKIIDIVRCDYEKFQKLDNDKREVIYKGLLDFDIDVRHLKSKHRQRREKNKAQVICFLENFAYQLCCKKNTRGLGMSYRKTQRLIMEAVNEYFSGTSNCKYAK